MKAEAFIPLSWLMISVPPYQRTMAMVIVPRNSLIGCASCWRRITPITVRRKRSLLPSKRSDT